MQEGMRALAVVLGCLGLVACSADTEGGDPRGPIVTHDGVAAPSPEPAAPVAKEDGRRARAAGAFDLGLPTPAPTSFVCRKGAFCDDFEDLPEQSIGARWSDVVALGAGKLEIDSESASVGKRAITLFTPDATSSVFLEQSGRGAAASWSGIVGFALKVETTPALQVGGPELVMKTADGPISVRVSLRREGLVLEQLAPESCGRDRCRPTSTILAPVKEGSWYRVRIGFEVNAQSSAPYGRIEAMVDGGPLLETDLNVPLYDGAVSLHAGITQGDAHRAVVNLDDVTLLVR